jgi:3-hydroxy-D-aspartate aldolase
MTLGPNEPLVGARDPQARLATPCLLLDADGFEHNLAAMMELARRYGREVRPHVKAHKCATIGRRQLEAGAVGLCCATVREAEVMADAGLKGILITSPVVAPGMIERLARAHDRAGDLAVVVDSEVGVEALAANVRAGRPLGVLVEIDVGQGRTGVTLPEDAVGLARRIEGLPQLRYRGLQAYYGHLQHVPGYADRKAKAAEQWARLRPYLDALSAEGLPPEVVTGGGTGTHLLDLEEGPFTEIQPGSYLFLDKQYGAIELAPGGTAPFRTSLTVATRVISANQADLGAGCRVQGDGDRRWTGPWGRRRRRGCDLPVHGRRARWPALWRRGHAAVGRRSGDPGRAALRPDRQPARVGSRHAQRASGRHLAGRRARLLGDCDENDRVGRRRDRHHDRVLPRQARP